MNVENIFFEVTVEHKFKIRTKKSVEVRPLIKHLRVRLYSSPLLKFNEAFFICRFSFIDYCLSFSVNDFKQFSHVLRQIKLLLGKAAREILFMFIFLRRLVYIEFKLKVYMNCHSRVTIFLD